MSRAQSPVQTLGAIVLVVLVVVAIAVFFYSGLTKQSSVLSSTSSKTLDGVNSKLDSNVACLPPATCCSTTDPGTPCCADC